METIMKFVGGTNIDDVIKHPNYKLVGRFPAKGCRIAFYYFEDKTFPERLQGFVVDITTNAVMFPVPIRRVKRKKGITHISSDIACTISHYYLEHCRLDQDLSRAMLKGDRDAVEKLDPTLYALLKYHYEMWATTNTTVPARWHAFTQIHAYERVPMFVLGVERYIWVERNLNLRKARQEVEYAIVVGSQERGQTAISFQQEHPIEKRLMSAAEYLMQPDNLPYLELHYSILDKQN